MDLPTSSEAFVAFMEHVWEGGPLYDEWHDAIKVARACGMVKCGPTLLNDQPAYVFRFPGALEGVRINRRGDALQVARLRRRA